MCLPKTCIRYIIQQGPGPSIESFAVSLRSVIVNQIKIKSLPQQNLICQLSFKLNLCCMSDSQITVVYSGQLQRGGFCLDCGRSLCFLYNQI